MVHEHDQAEWDRHRPVIEQKYIKEKMTRQQLLRHMEGHHGFPARYVVVITRLTILIK